MMQHILDKAVAGQRITLAEGLELLQSHDLVALGRAADAVSRRLHPEPYRTYNIDRNINYTNICTAVCDFCAFYRTPQERRRLRAAARSPAGRRSTRRSQLGGNQILLQGGLHPTLPLDVVRGTAAGHQAAAFRRSTCTASARRRSIISRRSSRLAAADGARASAGGRPGEHSGRRRGDPGRPRATGDHAWQGADRRLAASDAGLASSWAAAVRRR